MTEKAIDLLSSNPNGFFLIVECIIFFAKIIALKTIYKECSHESWKN